MSYLQDIDYSTEAAGDCVDELPLWSAPFGLMLLEHIPVRTGQTIVDVFAAQDSSASNWLSDAGPRVLSSLLTPGQPR